MHLFTSIQDIFGSGCTASPNDSVSRSSVSKPRTAGCSADHSGSSLLLWDCFCLMFPFVDGNQKTFHTSPLKWSRVVMSVGASF